MEKEGQDGCASPPWPAAQDRLKHLLVSAQQKPPWNQEAQRAFPQEKHM